MLVIGRCCSSANFLWETRDLEPGGGINHYANIATGGLPRRQRGRDQIKGGMVYKKHRLAFLSAPRFNSGLPGPLWTAVAREFEAKEFPYAGGTKMKASKNGSSSIGGRRRSNFAGVARLCFGRAAYAVALAVALATSANAKDGWAGCRSVDADSRISGCTQVIDNISKQSKHNKIAAYANRAGAYQTKGDWDHAVADFGKALELDPKSAVILSSRGAAYRGKGDFDHALADYDAAIAAQPKDSAAHVGRGGVYYVKGDYDRALADYDEAVKLAPKNAAAYVSRAIAWRQKGDAARELADLDEAVKLDSHSAAALTARGAYYQSLKDYDRAVADFGAAAKLEPKSAQAQSNLGLAYHGKGDFDHAIASFDAAIKIDSAYASAYLNRANAWRGKHELERAKRDYEAALKLKPDLASAKKGLEEVDKLIAQKSAGSAPEQK